MISAVLIQITQFSHVGAMGIQFILNGQEIIYIFTINALGGLNYSIFYSSICSLGLLILATEMLLKNMERFAINVLHCLSPINMHVQFAPAKLIL